jgi:hypothetical protein
MPTVTKMPSCARASGEHSEVVTVRRFPEQAAFVLDGIGPAEGIEAVVATRHLLDRLDALESSPAREATRAADHAALELLATRTLDRARRTELRAVVTVAQQSTGETPTTRIAKAQQVAEERKAALDALRAWLDEWSDVARTCIKRRDHLISLGLATRRPRSE